ncbi:hypothetical protein [Clostridium pasteurianum]|uniref:O-Antigen ligase n=1 Tax=Clostridium pasteurianum BC1 TaxID=86416 RepID=R4K5P7_CLOPA|nr:hypothetical protein [Clostridium pasteurianum]AGK95864.1 hypothetical protein Clopa_0840 [Clostridium pasteurianum BC1]
MELGIIGYFLIPLGIYLFFKDAKYLLYLIVFFSGFTAASVINFGSTFSLQPGYYFGIFFIIKTFLSMYNKKTLIRPNKFLFIFVIISILSIIMPTLINSKSIFIMNQSSLITNIFFTSSNITQLSYLLFCFILYLCIKNYFYHNPDEIEKSIKILVYSTIAVCLLGFYQEFAYLKHLEFDKFFRNGIRGNTQGAQNYFVRIYSVTQEPSMLGYFLAPMIALGVSLEKNILNNKYKILFLLLIIVTGILSTSTTFVVGLAALILKVIFDKLMLFIKDIHNESEKVGYILPIIFFTFILLLIVVVNLNPVIKDTLITGSYDKFMGNNLSGEERSSIFKLLINAAMHYPILGIGFGTARGKDLLSTWLCNVGFIAVGVFIIYLYKLITKLKNTSKLSYGISNYIFVLFACAFTSVPEPYNLFIWIIFAAAEVLIIKSI